MNPAGWRLIDTPGAMGRFFFAPKPPGLPVPILKDPSRDGISLLVGVPTTSRTWIGYHALIDWRTIPPTSTGVCADPRKLCFTDSGGDEIMKPGKKLDKGPIRIGIIGDFNPSYHSHFATSAAVYDAAVQLKTAVHLRWIPTPALAGDGAAKLLRRCDALLASPGSPYESFEGMLSGIKFARTHNWPFAGT